MSNLEETTPSHKKVLLSEVPVIRESSGQLISTREQIKKFVELPLLEACEELYDKNVMTLVTSANGKDIQMEGAYIIINFSSLSKTNREVAIRYGEPSFTLEYLKKLYGFNDTVVYDGYDVNDVDFWEGAGFYFDPQSQLFYMTREHFEKAQEFI